MSPRKVVLFSAICCLFSIYEVICMNMNRTSMKPPQLPQRKQLFADLMSNYGSKSVRPILSNSGPIEIKFSFVPIILASFDERNQHLSVVGEVYMTWIDKLLTWDPNDYGGINRISLGIQDLWTPDITVYERIGEGPARANIFDPYAIVNSSGHVSYFDLTYLTVYCRVDLVLFPFDTQLCSITVSSYSYDKEQLSLSFHDSVYNSGYGFRRNGVWKLVHVAVEEVHQEDPCCHNPFVQIRFTLELQRIGNFYIYSLGIPSVLLSLPLFAVFLMHPDSGEKVSLSISTVLAFVLFQQMVAANMPMSGEDAPIVETYFSVMIAASFFSVLANAFVLRTYHNQSKKPFPRLLRCLISRRKTRNSKTSSSSHQNIQNFERPSTQDSAEERRRILTSQSSYIDATINYRMSSRYEVDHNERSIISQTMEKVNGEEWKLLALRLDKIFLMTNIFILTATICYCAVLFNLHTQKYDERRKSVSNKTYRMF